MPANKVNLKLRPFPLIGIIYGIIGISFLQHKDEGFNRVARDHVYAILEVLANRHPQLFPDIFFVKRGNLMHSKQVEDALFRLGGVISQNIGSRHLFFLESELPFVTEKVDKWFGPQDKKLIEKLAEEFYQELKLKEYIPRNKLTKCECGNR